MLTFWFLWWHLVWPPPQVTPSDFPALEADLMQGIRVFNRRDRDTHRHEKAEVWATSKATLFNQAPGHCIAPASSRVLPKRLS